MISAFKHHHIFTSFRYNLYVLIVFLVLSACSKQPDAQEIIDQAIEVHGGKILNNAMIAFDFRHKHYTADLNNGAYEYTRSFKDSADVIKDFLHNDDFYREINGAKINLPDSMKRKYSSSVNSVHYFALLPKPLNDGAAIKKYLGIGLIKGQKYHKVQVTFTEEKGGVDHDDVFVYWIHKENHTMDYLAYKFSVNGGGTRFREAFNVREIEGVRFADYVNYKYTSLDTPLEHYDELFEDNQLMELSKIKLKNIKVTPR
ncbi:hypothetical protein QQ008_01150 [Fulvivirgaceae bacterium BMA10]|uniref:Deoxyribose-phosphate aldolase n=1 Tax=Splendidivirga corallicola TaxID=3051826 RepID=A0ABT8KGU7_9BACT|nr:hypothetical protein [Fulvivirgaceae bacterium BMA10]